MRALYWAYDQALRTLRLPAPPDARTNGNDPGEAADRDASEATIAGIVMWYAATAGCTGFATNLGGLVTLPVALPANLASVSLMQLRMVVQIAQQRGYQPADERVRTVAFLCLLGAAGASALEEFGVKLGTQLTARLIMQISGATLTRINQAVGFRLMTKAGTTGLVNLTRIVPFIGGIVGGGVDLALTLGVAEAAKAAFPRLEDPDPQAAGSG